LLHRKSTRTLENLAGGDVELNEEELKAINEAIGKHEITGDRYFGVDDHETGYLWG